MTANTRVSGALQTHGGARASRAELLPLLYRTEEHYGWSVGMRAITHALLAGVTLPDGPVVDLGCGGGRMLAELAAAFPNRPLCGIDLSAQAIAHAAESTDLGAKFVQADIHRLPVTHNTFALCLALDAYDQCGVDVDRALVECCRILRPGGVLVLRVSAHSWLLGPHDAAFNTGRRYEGEEMQHALRRSGLTPMRVTYANTLLSGPEGAVRMLQRWRLLPFLPALYTTRELNALLAAALDLEARWLRRRNLPGGMSLNVVARKLGRHSMTRPEDAS